jgi:hypothetical protein
MNGIVLIRIKNPYLAIVTIFILLKVLKKTESIAGLI